MSYNKMLSTQWIIIISVASATVVTGIILIVLWQVGLLFQSADEPVVEDNPKCTSTGISYKAKRELTDDYKTETWTQVAGYELTTMAVFGNFQVENKELDTSPINTVARFTITKDTEVVTSELKELPVTTGRGYAGTPFAATGDTVLCFAELKLGGELPLLVDYTNDESAFRLQDLNDTTKTQLITKPGYTARMCFHDTLEDELVLVWNNATQLVINTHKRDGAYQFLTTTNTSVTVEGTNKVDAYGGVLHGTTLIISNPSLPYDGKVLNLQRIATGWKVVELITHEDQAVFGWDVALSRDGLKLAVGSPNAASSNKGKIYTYSRATIDTTWTPANTLSAPLDLVTETLAATTSTMFLYGTGVAYIGDTLVGGSEGRFVLTDVTGTTSTLELDSITTYGRCSMCGTHRNGEREALIVFYQQDTRDVNGSQANEILPQVQYFTLCTAE